MISPNRRRYVLVCEFIGVAHFLKNWTFWCQIRNTDCVVWSTSRPIELSRRQGTIFSMITWRMPYSISFMGTVFTGGFPVHSRTNHPKWLWRPVSYGGDSIHLHESQRSMNHKWTFSRPIELSRRQVTIQWSPDECLTLSAAFEDVTWVALISMSVARVDKNYPDSGILAGCTDNVNVIRVSGYWQILPGYPQIPSVVSYLNL